MKMVTANDLAAELRRRLPGIGTKKLHKLLYYCQGHHLATFGTPLFSETISAWDMGPVIGTLWKKETGEEAPADFPPDLAEAVLNTLGYVVSRYGALTGGDLERLTHSESPWIEANRRRLPRTSAKIPIESIRAYFAGGSSNDDEDAPMPDADAVAAFLEDAEARFGEEARTDSIEELRSSLTTRA